MASSVYGRQSLANLRPFGIAVRVACAGVSPERSGEYARRLDMRLRSRSVRVVPEGSVVLKLFLTSVRTANGRVAAHLRLQVDQAALLASTNQPVDAPTWDAWKLGEYGEDEIPSEIDDLARQFLNDYVSVN